MKKNYFFTLLMTLITAVSFGQVLISEDFTYTDGSLIGNSTREYVGGTAGDLLVASGQAVVQHGTPSEDVKITWTAVAGDVYAGFDFSVDDLGSAYDSGTDFEYFVHLGFKARMDIQAATAGGDYTVGISSGGSTAEATMTTDLTFGQAYRAILKFDQVTGTAKLWIDPAVSTDASISGSGVGAFTVPSFDLRQSDSSKNETVRVDNLMIGQTFDDVLVFAAPTASLKNNSIQGFATYPNPITNKKFTVSSSNSETKQVTIFNVLGEKVFASSFTGLKKDIDVSTVNSGVYILKVTESGKTATKKLVIR